MAPPKASPKVFLKDLPKLREYSLSLWWTLPRKGEELLKKQTREPIAIKEASTDFSHMFFLFVGPISQEKLHEEPCFQIPFKQSLLPRVIPKNYERAVFLKSQSWSWWRKILIKPPKEALLCTFSSTIISIALFSLYAHLPKSPNNVITHADAW